MTHPINQFLLGGLVVACATVGCHFLRFWRKTRDRLFGVFAVAFWLLGLNWLLLAFANRDETSVVWLYLIRLAAFFLILLAIWDKNRAPRPPLPPPSS